MRSFSLDKRRHAVFVLALLLALAELYFLLAINVSEPGDGDGWFFVATVPGLLMVVALAVGCIPFRNDLPALLVIIGVGAVGGAALSAPAPEAAAPFKALFGAGAGLALARLIPIASFVYLLAILVAIADSISVSVGPTNYLVNEQPDVVDYLALSIPSWGGTTSQLGVSDLVFTGVYLSIVWRFGLRRRVTVAAIAASLVASLAIAVWTDWIVPALPLLSLALLAPNADLVWRQMRADLEKLE